MQRAQTTNKYNINMVKGIYTNRGRVPNNIAEKTAMALYMPSLFGSVGKRGKPGKADAMYEDFLSIYKKHQDPPPPKLGQDSELLRHTDRETRENHGDQVNLPTEGRALPQARKDNPNNERSAQPRQVYWEAHPNHITQIRKATHQGLLQYWAGNLTVQAFSDRVINQQKNKPTKRGANEFKLLCHICMTEEHFKDRALKAPGYLDGIYILDWAATNGEKRGTVADPQQTRKRASGGSVAIL